jgi:DNA repair protein RecO
MHHKYHTKGFILSYKNIGEANKIINLYTEDFGFIRAIAQGVRLHKSKLRFSLQDFSFSKIDLIKGRDMWRITSASHIDSFPNIKNKKEIFIFCNKLFSLIERLFGEEDMNKIIFEDIYETFQLLESEIFDKNRLSNIEAYTILRILYNLGYIEENQILNKYIKNKFNKDDFEMISEDKRFIIVNINKALNESHL